MSTSLDRVRVAERPTPPPAPPAAPPTSDGRTLGRRWDRWRRIHGRAPLHLIPLLLITGIVQAWNLAGAPQRIDDEGTYVAQAWAISNLGELAHYTYWYDHPPLGWIQLAAYTDLTGAFSRWDTAVMAGREAVLVATLVSTALLWLLGRKIGLSRGTATAAALLFALSPLALQFHRTVYLDNIATPWLLGALILAMSRKHQLAEFVGAAVLFGIAVLTKETYLLALPLLAYVMYRSAWPATRRYTLSVAASMLVLVGLGYLLFAAINGELFPGQDRVSLVDGVAFQLASRESSGTVADPDSLINRTLAMWWQLDPVFITAGLAAAAVALFLRPLRPYALLVLALVAFMFRPGSYLPVPYVIMLLPFAALLVAGTAGWAVRQLRSGTNGALLMSVTVLSALAIAALVAVPLWATQLRGFLLADLDRPGVQAQEWVEENVARSDRLIVDDSMWVDLVSSGFDRDNVIWYYKLDTDSDVMEASPNGWRDSDYIITTDSMRTFPEQFPQVDQALSNSEVVASFGTGPQTVDVRRIHPGGLEEQNGLRAEQDAQRADIGGDLTRNPALDLSAEARAQLAAGQVDARIVVALGLRASMDSSITASFPARDGEDGSLRRQVLLSATDGTDLGEDTTRAAAVRSWFENLQPVLAPASVQETDDGVLVTFPLDQPAALLPG
ncbi:glycosyltransferase family 39 protein [Arthrobacter sp. RIT-PI-e]|uniref:glycosyltransferase family 39 protein n=1 Tax=Arthrobacter sp. RIT-PI-e TaxID=1681197 RepID=UPI00067666D1|nr:glycosyltransferase family 39 protein [Arthrobacter sp. RIT-PI-e]